MSEQSPTAFLSAIDAELAAHAQAKETLDLNLLGRSALILGYGLTLMTKDVDIVFDHSNLQALAIKLFGRHGTRRSQDGLYLEAVSSGLPPLPIGYQRRCKDLPGPWRVIRPKLPDAHDLVVSKLSRFHAGDRLDVQILCDQGGVTIGSLRERLDSAFTFSDPDDPKRLLAIDNLATIEAYLEGRRRNL